MLKKFSGSKSNLKRSPFSFLDKLFGGKPTSISRWLLREVDYALLHQFVSYPQTIAYYRYVDVHHAINRFAESLGGRHLDANYNYDLNCLLHPGDRHQAACQIVGCSSQGFDVDIDEREFVPTSRFWAINNGEAPVVIRQRLNEHNLVASFSVASPDKEYAEDVLKQILEDSRENSIYRGRLIEAGFEASVDPNYGHIRDQGVDLKFVKGNHIGPEDIILDPKIHSILKRNVFDFHDRRELLQRIGVPNKKGLLFHGPPGTGKTFTCKYIYGQLEGVTCIIVSGKTLTQIKPICDIARLLQPSLVVLEDVDLVFKSREINLYSSVLGDLMDELDGFQSDDAVTFLLTTNAIERMEAAIKDRPGRISQCVFFGPPSADLRKRYLVRYLESFDVSELDLKPIIEFTDGTTQAFLKELVFRAAQVALEGEDELGSSFAELVQAKENSGFESDSLKIRNQDFVEAYREMASGSHGSAAAIVGFGNTVASQSSTTV